MVLKSASVTRAHIHHLMSMDLDVRALLHRLGVPFDVTVHDYFAICPQVNLLPWLQGAYCGEPDIADCNACIANRSSYGSRDIVSWRRGNAWQFIEAERVICPSEDVRRRLARYRLRPAGDRGAARTGDRRAMADHAIGARQGSCPARRGDRRARQPEGRGHRDDRGSGGRSGRVVHPRDRLRRTGAAGAARRAHRDDRPVRRGGAAGAARQGEARMSCGFRRNGRRPTATR